MKFFLFDPIVVSYKIMMGKEKEDNTPSKALEVPTAEIGTPVPVVWGTRILKQPSIAWYGDITIKKIKVSTEGKK